MNTQVSFSMLKGKTLTKVDNLANDKIVFMATDGEVYMLYHSGDSNKLISWYVKSNDCCSGATNFDLFREEGEK